MKIKDSIFINYCDKYEIIYEEGNLKLDDYIEFLELAIKLDISDKYKEVLDNLKNKKYDMEKLEESKNNYLKGIDAFNDSLYSDSIIYLEKVIKNDSNYSDALEKIELSKTKIKEKEDLEKREKEKRDIEVKKRNEEEKKNNAYNKVYNDIVNQRVKFIN